MSAHWYDDSAWGVVRMPDGGWAVNVWRLCIIVVWRK